SDLLFSYNTFFSLLRRRPPRSTLFPYTTLFRSETFDVAGAVREVVTTIEPLMKKRHNRLALTLPDDLGTMHGDLVKVRQLLFNRSEEHTSELQSRGHLVCRLLLEKKKTWYDR